MNRISRRSAAETAEALLEVGRTQPVLHYDVELGLERHHEWLRNDAPVPEWASAGVGTAARSLMPAIIKTFVSSLLIGTVGVAGWYALSRPQPSEAGAKLAAPAPEATHAAAPGVPDVTASEAWMARTPLPVLDPGPPSEQPARRARADAADRRAARAQRAHRESRSLGARADAPAAAEAPSTPLPAASAVSARASDVEAPEPATANEVAAAPERKPATSQKTAPQPAARAQAQAPDDLAEMQQVASAEQLLERSPQRALALVRQGDQRFAHGYFQQERAYITIMSLIRLGRLDEARTRAASFAKQFPPLPYGARIRSALEARDAARPIPARDPAR